MEDWHCAESGHEHMFAASSRTEIASRRWPASSVPSRSRRPSPLRQTVHRGATASTSDALGDGSQRRRCSARAAAGVVRPGDDGRGHVADRQRRARRGGRHLRRGVRRASEATLMVGAGTNDTRTTIERHEALADVQGGVASLAVVPYYVRPTERAIVRHFAACVAERSPVPIVALQHPVPDRARPAVRRRCSSWRRVDAHRRAASRPWAGIDGDTLTVLAQALRTGFAMLGGDDRIIYAADARGQPPGVAIAASATGTTTDALRSA